MAIAIHPGRPGARGRHGPRVVARPVAYGFEPTLRAVLMVLVGRLLMPEGTAHLRHL